MCAIVARAKPGTVTPSNITILEPNVDSILLNGTLSGNVEITSVVNGRVNIPQAGPAITSTNIIPLEPDYTEKVTVTATITDVDYQVDQTLLSYTYNMGWHNISMNVENSTFFYGTIHSQPYGTLVQYKIYAHDTGGYTSESDIYSYTVGDFTPPQIGSIAWLAFNLYPTIRSNTTWSEEPILIIANITEPSNASGVSKVLFSYRANGGDWWNTTMRYNATTGLWSVLMPGQLGNASIEFFITAYDKAGNVATSSINSFTIETLKLGDLGSFVNDVPTFFKCDGKCNYEDIPLFIDCYRGTGP